MVKKRIELQHFCSMATTDYQHYLLSAKYFSLYVTTVGLFFKAFICAAALVI